MVSKKNLKKTTYQTWKCTYVQFFFLKHQKRFVMEVYLCSKFNLFDGARITWYVIEHIIVLICTSHLYYKLGLIQCYLIGHAASNCTSLVCRNCARASWPCPHNLTLEYTLWWENLIHVQYQIRKKKLNRDILQLIFLITWLQINKIIVVSSDPLIGATAAGNIMVLKPSELVPVSSSLL